MKIITMGTIFFTRFILFMHSNIIWYLKNSLSEFIIDEIFHLIKVNIAYFK